MAPGDRLHLSHRYQGRGGTCEQGRPFWCDAWRRIPLQIPQLCGRWEPKGDKCRKLGRNNTVRDACACRHYAILHRSQSLVTYYILALLYCFLQSAEVFVARGLNASTPNAAQEAYLQALSIDARALDGIASEQAEKARRLGNMAIGQGDYTSANEYEYLPLNGLFFFQFQYIFIYICIYVNT